MSISKRNSTSWLAAALAAAALGVSSGVLAQAQQVTLTGDHEVPAVKSAGSAKGDVTVKPDGSVSGTIKVTGFAPTAAHIHQGAAGASGPVIVPMTKQGDDTFVFAPNAKMTPEQYAAYKAGNTYVNVHSAANPGGEVRAQLKGQ